MDRIIAQYKSVPFGELSICLDKQLAYQTKPSNYEYGEQYYNNYINREGTEIAVNLNKARVNLAKKYCKKVLDIGIGSGEFIKNFGIDCAYGFDINPYGIKWLKENHIYMNPYEEDISVKVDGVTLWDTLEHMVSPSEFLDYIEKEYVIVSLPIFDNILKVKNSKHFKPGEHLLYFTAQGLINLFEDNGFNVIEMNDAETLAGRENILSFVFRRS